MVLTTVLKRKIKREMMRSGSLRTLKMNFQMRLKSKLRERLMTVIWEVQLRIKKDCKK